jgi:cell division protein FtsB
MMIFKKKKYKKFFSQIPQKIVKNLFLFILGLFFISFLIGGWLFYKYVFLVEQVKPEKRTVSLKIEEEIYHKIISELEKQEKEFQKAKTKTFSDPF